MVWFLAILLGWTLRVCARSYESMFDEWANTFRIQFDNLEHRAQILDKWIDNHVFIQRVNALNYTGRFNVLKNGTISEEYFYLTFPRAVQILVGESWA